MFQRKNSYFVGALNEENWILEISVTIIKITKILKFG